MRLPAGIVKMLATRVDGLTTVSTGPTGGLFDSTPLAGISVDKDSALSLSAFWGCVRYISSQVGIMPWGVYRTPPGGGREEQRNHRAWAMLHDAPAPWLEPDVLRSALVWNACVQGNGYAAIRGDRLQMLDSSAMKVLRSAMGDVLYEYTDPYNSNQVETFIPAQLLHLKGPSRDGVVGLSVVAAAAEGIGFGLGLQSFGAGFFGNGTHVGGIYKTDKTLTDEQFQRLQKQISDARGAKKAHNPRILESGLDYIANTIPPQDAQFLELRKFSAREMAALFGVPPHKIGVEDGATAYASREQAAIESVVDCLLPWVVRLEQQANMKLLTPADRKAGFYTKLSVDAILRGDAKGRAEANQIQLRNGALTPGEWRQLEDRPATGEGAVISRDLIPVDQLPAYADSQIASNVPQPSASALEPMVQSVRAAVSNRIEQDAKRGGKPRDVRDFAAKLIEPIARTADALGIEFDDQALLDEMVRETP